MRTARPLSSQTLPSVTSCVVLLDSTEQSKIRVPRPNRLPLTVRPPIHGSGFALALTEQAPPSTQLPVNVRSLTAPASCVTMSAALEEPVMVLPTIAMWWPASTWIPSSCDGPPHWFGSFAYGVLPCSQEFSIRTLSP